MNKRYFKCCKCGTYSFVDSEDTLSFLESKPSFRLPCIQKAEYRFSGMCGGSYVEVTEEEYKKGEEEYKKLNKNE